jgi:hypothetical protein
VGHYEERVALSGQITSLSDEIQIAANKHEGLAFSIEVCEDQITLLLENIAIMKSPGIILVASEYRKAIIELSEAKTSLKELKKNFRELDISLRRLRAKFAKLVGHSNELRLVTGTVLYGNFKRPKNGQN